LPEAIEIKILLIPENAEPSIKSANRGILIDLREAKENTSD
jgi:hypothetical protein